ncbi:translocation/assembly module TamB domain-containing protein [Tabrizicola oligotrophica]|uniref:Translocation and assembly module protein TamB n=1 Tax=Tabrizicola oligotrophica TaxID=2710650 RepID=A0A6M0QTC4_9RHOB|nr:translocation/assembly module TamB domain-containing protein [Tabrizicola oligotrophica]NEY90261.1 translocation and assembly module protein TamB [Tabrizicola oligotrophica]
MNRTALLALCLLPLPAFAQSDDRSYLTAFLEDNLSGAGRQVVITGFDGALSSQARIAELTIADEQGVWLTLRDVVLDWNRSALFSGNVSVNELSAAEIIVARPPVTGETSPQPEAGSFSLPDLPVSVEIGRLAADRITLGPEVLGQAVEGRLEADLTLSGGIGDANLLLERQDSGPDGRIALKASYSNETRLLGLDLTAAEAAGGLVATALNLPGHPAAELKIIGNGPISDFVADVALSTDGQPRLAGRVVTQSGLTETGFAANLSGDVAPLFLPDYAEFFGDRVELVGSGTAFADGRIDLSRLSVTAKAIDLAGSVSLAADGSPSRFDLKGRLAHADRQPVLLPLTTEIPVRVESADLAISFDKSRGEGWQAETTVYGLDRADFRANKLTLTGSGRIRPGEFGATCRFRGDGLQPTDAAMARALGSRLSGDAVLYYRRAEGSFAIPELNLQGADYGATLSGARIAGLAEGLALSGKISARLDDLSRLDGLAGVPLAGSAQGEISGNFTPLSGTFDLAVKVDGQDMQSGQAMLDSLMRGQTSLAAHLQRNEAGLRLSRGRLTGNGLEALIEGLISSTASDLTAQFRLDDLASLGDGFGGAIEAGARMTGPLATAHITTTANGKALRSGNAEVDKLLTGESRIAADLDLRSGKVQINRATLTSPEIKATVAGLADGAEQVLNLEASLRNLGLLLPEFPGPLSVTGTITRDSAGMGLDVSGKGPGGIEAAIKGQIAPERSDLTIRGRAQAGLANAFLLPRSMAGQVGFDLRLNGPMALSSLSGPVTLERGRLSDPSLAFAFDGISARATLSGGTVNLTGSLPLTTSGKVAVSGTVGLAEPFVSALGLDLQGVTLHDPDLFETRLAGALRLTGPLLARPLLAGRITLIETELRVPSTGFGGAAGLPELLHRNEPEDVRATRARAGLLTEAEGAARSGGGDLGLDVTISAPNRVFIRGRGLDAELGGEVRLLGSLSALAPAGAFNLIRGRLDILGKRFDLDEALMQLEGDLVPFLRIVASTENDGITANVLIEGRADDPKVSFTSTPDLPEEEVVAQLLFGQGLQNLSALQALQLASAVATLAGRGGEGVMTKLRQGIGIDNLDVKTTAEGGTEVTAGKYIGKNAYTEVTVGQDGKSQINLNLDLTDSITLRGRAGSDGQTGVGVFVEKDY